MLRPVSGSSLKSQRSKGAEIKNGIEKKYSGLIIHDVPLATCHAPGESEVVAMKITGHKTASMYRRYRIVDENELRDAQQKMQRLTKTQTESKIVATGGKQV